ncbi:MAG: hypothetical protein DUD39_09680 [Coriobacteriaceae bacterium]|nr:MAG: hypothetical protein DUD39_09680 [Coriobacteriaceae bacterium]
MLLLDRNNEPTSTVYYLAAESYDYLKQSDGADALTVYRHLDDGRAGKKLNYDFYLMAIDFLYLIDKLSVDERGGLHVH